MGNIGFGELIIIGAIGLITIAVPIVVVVVVILATRKKP